MRKTDYQKGLTAGLALRKKHKRVCAYPYANRDEIYEIAREAERKYSDTIGDMVCPFTGEPSYMRTSWYMDGVRDAMTDGYGHKFIIVRFNGHGHYTVADLAEQTVYDDPCFAWKRSWELDPQGHKFKMLDVLYVNGAMKHLGLEEVTAA